VELEGDDDEVVPVIQLEEFFVIGGVEQGGDGVLFTVFPVGLLACGADATASAAFVVNEAGDVGELVFVANFMLVSDAVSSLCACPCDPRRNPDWNAGGG
jgi:hypothetical protein